MDNYLIDYLKSGKAWVLVGSGPSIEMGYPSWRHLAIEALNAVKVEARRERTASIQRALARNDYPRIFEEAQKIIGFPKLLEVLSREFSSVNSANGRVYELIAHWPVPVYLTTNYDDEIQRQLTNLGETYINYSNSIEHFGYLLPDLEGAIVKLHGDLRSQQGLVLTANQYNEIEMSDYWEYWRVKMTSIFQMNRVVVIGHSLSDENIRHVLRAAKQGPTVLQPICWIAPDVPLSMVRQYLKEFKIRVIPYENSDGTHRNLVKLLENISQFIPPRTVVRINEQIAKVSKSPLGNNAAAPGFYVFNKLSIQSDFDQKRVDIVTAAMQSTLPILASEEQFTLDKAFEISGWPAGVSIPFDFAQSVQDRAVQEGLLSPVGNYFRVGEKASGIATENRTRFEHMRDRFRQSLKLRAKRSYPVLTDEEAATIAFDIEASLTGYFREGGLTLSTTLFSSKHQAKHSVIPSSILKFINEASAKYDSLLLRQAFSTTSVDIFVRGESAERDYLGRISQGFFAYHSLGVFGDVARERLIHAKETVWLVDSNVQIPALALAAATHPVFSDCLKRLNQAGVRFFTTDKLCRETLRHLNFADRRVSEYGSDSPEIIAAAIGQVPYRRSNQFLEGFINWKRSTGSHDWNDYLASIFDRRQPGFGDVRTALQKLGVEVISLADWPGFSQLDFSESTEYASRIVDALLQREQEAWDVPFEEVPSVDEFQSYDPYKKATPEAEALLIVKKERSGSYHMLSGDDETSDSWFISDTWVLNSLDPDVGVITFDTVGFLKFASTIFNASASANADEAFQTLLWACAQSGLSLLDERTVESVIGSDIEQELLNLKEQKEIYTANLGSIYGPAPESVIDQIRPSNKLWAIVQMSYEMARKAEERRLAAETVSEAALRRANLAEKELSRVEKFREQMEMRKKKGLRTAKKHKAKKK